MSAEELRAKIREIPDFPKPGILFYDITTLLKDQAAYKEAIDLMLEPYQGETIDIVVGMESRGFIFSSPMAYQLNAGLVPVRKLGKLPAETITVEYALEYGSNTLEIHRDAIEPGQKVLIVDDLLATGGTVKGTIELVERLKGNVVGPRVPRRAGLPQGSRPARRPARHERHPVLSPTPLRAADARPPCRPEPDLRPTPRRREPPIGPGRAHRVATGPRAGRGGRGPSRPAALLPPVRGRSDPDRGDGRGRGPGAPARVGGGGRRDPRSGDRRCRRRRRGTARRARRPAGRRPASGTPFREADGLLILIDQRQLPDELVEVEIRNGPEAAAAIR